MHTASIGEVIKSYVRKIKVMHQPMLIQSNSECPITEYYWSAHPLNFYPPLQYTIFQVVIGIHKVHIGNIW